MVTAIIPILLGVLFIVIGISNRKGNISSLHSYHRHRVRDEDRLPMGKAVGFGMILNGCSLIAFGGFSIAALLTDREMWVTVGTAVMSVGLAVGIIITVIAIQKYNKGLF